MKRWWRVLGIVLLVSMLLTSAASAGTCGSYLYLPDEVGTVKMGSPYQDGTLGTYFDLILGGVDGGFDIRDDTWPGWCADWNLFIEGPYPPTNDPYVYTLPRIYSSLDPELSLKCPTCAGDEQWDKINWLLNNRPVGSINGPNFWEMQAAIWYLADTDAPDLAYLWPSSLMPSYSTAKIAELVADAHANGVDFCPGVGQIAAVIVYIDQEWRQTGQPTQLVFIEVGVTEILQEPEGVGTPGYWKNHPEAWPLTELTIGGKVYTQQAALDLLTQAEKGDKSLTLFRALVAALLNKAAGNNTTCIDSTIVGAQTWMQANPTGSRVKASSDAWKVAEPMYELLDAYNNGLLCAPSRG
jgi:hypothetical protein